MSDPGANAMHEMNAINDDADASPTGAAGPGIQEVLRDLTGRLGPTLVAVLSGDQEPRHHRSGRPGRSTCPRPGGGVKATTGPPCVGRAPGGRRR